MSYSFTVRAATKHAAKLMVRDEFIKVVSNQLCHLRDKDQAVKVADDFIDLLTEDDTKDFVVQMHGSLTGMWSGSDVTRIEGSNVNVSAALAARQPAA